MKTYLDKKSVRSVIILAGAGFFAGMLNGFLGAGGGIILLTILAKLNPEHGDRAARDNFASAVAAVVPLSVVSAVSYSVRGSVDISLIVRFILPAVLGGVIGAYLTDKLKISVLRTVFSVLLIIAGVNMLVR